MSEAPRNLRRKEARPSEIIEAALQLFHQKGFSATKIDEVAIAAGVTKGTVYLYFPSKEALFKAVVQERVLPNLAKMNEAANQFAGSRADCLAYVLRGMAQALNECNGSISKLMIAEAGNFPELAAFYNDEVVQPMHRAIRQILSEGIARQEFREMDLEHMPRIVIAPIFMANIWRHTYGHLDAQPLELMQYAEIQIDVLLRGLLATPENKQ
ncbi:TetR/AcrR family transcriptional regulator [Chitinibacter bivalviorum]|uniref:TetR/AcrR family transcriptional regulator n=1 Tax=Chitinibacter bivalviorum TaxID=2739434 RepID=A0A7H9BIB4_9NEIS|nr:TetR/AcrR family transcriptional regulator [Chitinibacter bivalviorum]QLG88463.1 TetR/AcrR family transcriptional regulator [Chitinibacter bivalviorum]